MASPNIRDRYEPLRLAMVEQQLRRRGIRDERILAAFARVPRHEFVAPDQQRFAYEDRPLRISAGQTISQPYIVAAMLQAAELRAEDCVLEIGTGSGYQSALLAELCREVFSIERHAMLAEKAWQALKRLGYANVQVRVGDGTLGWAEAAPFDSILVTAAGPDVPPALIQQLAEGGRMLIPVGSRDHQDLLLLRKVQEEILTTRLDPCLFVPLIGEQGYGG